MLSPIQLKKEHNRIYKKAPVDSASGQSEVSETDNAFFNVLEAEIKTPLPPSSNPVNPVNPQIPWEEISGLVGELESQGQAISRLPSLDNFHRYRDLLQKIITQILPHALEIHKDYSLNPKDLTQKEYHLVTGINKELGSLLKMIESNHKDHFKIANQVISIKGLIIDFYS